MDPVLIISIPSVMIGIGRLIHRTEIRKLTTGNLLEPMKAIHCPITTQFSVLTGNDNHVFLRNDKIASSIGTF